MKKLVLGLGGDPKRVFLDRCCPLVDMNGLRGAINFYPELRRPLGESECLLGCLSYAVMLKFIGVGESPAQILVENTNSDPNCTRFLAGRVLVDDANSFRSSVNESQLGITCVVSP